MSGSKICRLMFPERMVLVLDRIYAPSTYTLRMARGGESFNGISSLEGTEKDSQQSLGSLSYSSGRSSER